MVYQLFWGLYARDSNPSDTSGVEESGTYDLTDPHPFGFTG